MLNNFFIIFIVVVSSLFSTTSLAYASDSGRGVKGDHGVMYGTSISVLTSTLKKTESKCKHKSTMGTQDDCCKTSCMDCSCSCSHTASSLIPYSQRSDKNSYHLLSESLLIFNMVSRTTCPELPPPLI